MRIPDTLTDETYNEDYLKEIDSLFVAGFNYAVDRITDIFFSLEDYKDTFDELKAHFNTDDSETVVKILTSVNLYEMAETTDNDKVAYKEEYEEALKTATDTVKGLVALKSIIEGEMKYAKDDLVVSILEEYTDEEYEELKEKAKSGKHKNCLARQKEESTTVLGFIGELEEKSVADTPNSNADTPNSNADETIDGQMSIEDFLVDTE